MPLLHEAALQVSRAKIGKDFITGLDAAGIRIGNAARDRRVDDGQLAFRFAFDPRERQQRRTNDVAWRAIGA